MHTAVDPERVVAQVESTGLETRNGDYQKMDRTPKGSAVWQAGFAGLPQVVGKRIRVTVEVLD
jgi:hypothetical protein